MAQEVEGLGVVVKKGKKSRKVNEVQEEEGATENTKGEKEDALASRKQRKKGPAVDEIMALAAANRDMSNEILVAKKERKHYVAADEVSTLALESVDGSNETGPVKKKRKKYAVADEAITPAADATAKVLVTNSASANTESFQVFVGGVPWAAAAETLKADFSECGEVTDVNLLTDARTGLPRGIAFISFKDEAGMRAALKYDGEPYGGRTLKVTQVDGRNAKGSGKGREKLEVFIKGLPGEIKEKSLKKHFVGCGELIRVNMPTDDAGKCKGFAWITFSTTDGLDQALTLNGKEFKGVKLVVEKSGQHKKGDCEGKGKGGKDRGRPPPKGNKDWEVFVRNLPYEADEQTLRKDFLECGEIDRLHMPTAGAEGKCMGFAWITFRTREGFENALAYNGDDYAGRRMYVEKAGQHGGKSMGRGKAD